MGMAVAIQTHQLTRRFGTQVAVDNLNLTINQGEVFGFLGHNGAGKTTTVRLLNGLLQPSSGQATVLGLSPEHQGHLLRARTGVLTETPAIDERLSAQENLVFAAGVFGIAPKQIDGRVQEVLAWFGLSERSQERSGGFSKGMKQRLALARTLLHRPQLVFLDEPTSGLDPVAAKEVHQLILQMRSEGRTVFLTTHNLAEAAMLCDRVAVIEHGQLKACGTPHELSAQLALDRLVLQLDLPQVSQAQKLLQEMHFTVKATGSHLEVWGVSREQVPQIIHTLVNANFAIYQAQPQSATLEDVYFALHPKPANP